MLLRCSSARGPAFRSKGKRCGQKQARRLGLGRRPVVYYCRGGEEAGFAACGPVCSSMPSMAVAQQAGQQRQPRVCSAAHRLLTPLDEINIPIAKFICKPIRLTSSQAPHALLLLECPPASQCSTGAVRLGPTDCGMARRSIIQLKLLLNGRKQGASSCERPQLGSVQLSCSQRPFRPQGHQR